MVSIRAGVRQVVHVHDKPLSEGKRTWLAGVGVLCALALLLAAHAGVLWLLAAAILCGFTIWQPWAGLLALPYAVAFGSLSSLQLSSFHVGPTDALVGSLALAAIARMGQRLTNDRGRGALADARGAAMRLWRARRFHCVVALSLLAYLAVVCVSALVATQRTATAKEALKWSEVFIVAACTVWLVVCLRRMRLLVWAMIGAALLEALVGLGQWAADGGDLATGGQIRIVGTFAQPNPYAAYLNLALPIALALVLFSRDRRQQCVAGAASVLLIGAEYLAHSRGAMLGLAAAMFVLVVLGLRRERLALVLAAALAPLIALAWLAGAIPARLVSAITRQFHVAGTTVCGRVDASDFSTVERIAHWVAGLRMFAAHPILGVGAGNYAAAYPRFACADWPEALGHAHNYYINTAAELGVIGLVAFLALVACVLHLGWRASHRVALDAKLGGNPGGAETRRLFAIALLAALIGVAVHNLTDDLFVHAMELQMALCVGCLLRLDGLLQRDR